jgi:hypothetical protein
MGTHPPQEVTRQKLKFKSTTTSQKTRDHNNQNTTNNNTLIKLKTINFFKKDIIICHKISHMGI